MATPPYVKRPAGGIKIERNTTTADEWTTGPWEVVPGATATITLPGGTPTKVDITTHEDVLTYGGFRQNGAGLADTTDLSFTVLIDPDNTVHQALLTDLKGRIARNYRITFPGGITTLWGVRGQVGMTAQGDINDYLRGTVTILANTVNFDVGA